MISAQATHRFPSARRPLVTAVAALLIATACIAPALAEDFYTQEKVYNLRPKADGRKDFGHLGPTGIVAYIHPGVKVQVEQIAEGSPAAGKIEKDDVILGVNGVSLKGLNPFVAVGEALTGPRPPTASWSSRSSPGQGDAQRVTVTIPVLGAYSDTWPLDCAKSKKVIEQAAAYYADPAKVQTRAGIPGALIVPVPAVDRRRRPPAAWSRGTSRLHGQGQDRHRRPHLEQRLQRHRLCRVLPAHR
jgi:hypothetical protein